MPNFSGQQQNLLSESELALSNAARQPGLASLSDAALMKLISDLDTAFASAGPAGTDGEKTRADLLRAALNRAHAERRKRKLRPDGSARPDVAAADAAVNPAPAIAVKPASASPRKPARRKAGDSRKTDLRTGSRRVAKKVASPEKDSATAAVPAPAAQPEEAQDLSGKDLKKAEKQAKKAGRKAAKQAEKMVLKAAKDSDKSGKKKKKQDKKKDGKDRDKKKKDRG